MATICLCMIVKNEEDVLRRVLDTSRGIYDELVIVDTGSTDSTKEIAHEYTDKVYDFEWCDNFSAARNYAFSLAESDYILWLDADDVIEETDKYKIINIKKSLDPSIDIVMLKYYIAFDENNTPTFEYYRERIIRNDGIHLFSGRVHEAIPLFGNIVYEDAAICHRKIHLNPPKRNLKIYESMINDGSTFNAREKYYYARELYFNKKYDEAIQAFQDFLSEKEAYSENQIDACKLTAHAYYSLNMPDIALTWLFKSFVYGLPRPDICCNIAGHFFDRNMYTYAIYWYEKALEYKHEENSGAFIDRDFMGFVPYLGLCVCSYRIGDIDASVRYNNLAEKIKPYHPSVKYNKKFFQDTTNI